MTKKMIKIAVLCIIAAFLNIFSSYFFRDILGLPLFMDTVFTAAISFTFGLIPGIITAVLSWILPSFYWHDISLFILCSITEVLIICALKPADLDSGRLPDYSPKERILSHYLVIATKLMFLYIICAISVSITGGIIDYISPLVLETHLQYYHVENTFKLGLIMNNMPTLAVNIISRIPVNIVDRFIVIIGGYFISLGIVKTGLVK